MKVNTNIEINIEDFAISLTHSEALEIVRVIDKEQQAIDFTHACAVYFVKELLKYEPEWLEEIRSLVVSARGKQKEQTEEWGSHQRPCIDEDHIYENL